MVISLNQTGLVEFASLLPTSSARIITQPYIQMNLLKAADYVGGTHSYVRSCV